MRKGKIRSYYRGTEGTTIQMGTDRLSFSGHFQLSPTHPIITKIQQHKADVGTLLPRGFKERDYWLPEKLRIAIEERLYLPYRIIYINVPEDIALNIENQRDKIKAQIRYHLTGKVKEWKSTSNLPPGYFTREYTLEIKDVSVIFVRADNSVVYEKRL